MDLPNVTLFFQILNFYIAYRVLYVFVFAPALQILVAQDCIKANIQAKITQAIHDNDQMLTTQKNGWVAMKNKLLDLMPEKLSVCFLGKRPADIETTSVELLSREKKDQIVNTLSRELLDIKS